MSTLFISIVCRWSQTTNWIDEIKIV